MSFLKIAACLLLSASVCLAQQFTCPQLDGSFVYGDTCAKYWRCDGGVPTLLDCQPQLLFNSLSGYCDWPDLVTGNDCQKPDNSELLENDVLGICSQEPEGVNPGEAYHVAHPSVCNAFYTCSPQYLYAPCTFCPEFMYFDSAANGCRSGPANQPDALCNGIEYISHDQKVFRTIDGTCWPFFNIPNPYNPLIEAINNGGFGQNNNNNNNNNNNFRQG